MFTDYSVLAQSESAKVTDYITGPYLDNTGKEISMITVPGKPPSGHRAPIASPTSGSHIINSVPAYEWSFGCAPTAAAMAAGYYDKTGYPDIYTGLANGGIMPLNNTIWGTVEINGQILAQCPLSATMQGLDGRVTRGHVDDYWNYYENGDPDPYIVNNWPEHQAEVCTGDFMGSNQSVYSNPDGASTFFMYTDGSPLYDFDLLEPQYRDGCHGLKLFYESRGYQIVENYSQMIYGYSGNTLGFTFGQYIEEIDNGRPVILHVAGHSILGIGYDETNQLVYLHDTWDHNLHVMIWGGSYEGRQHFGATVIRLASDYPPPVASFSVSSSEVEPGQSISFYDNSSGFPLSWQWTFEGGNPSASTEQNPVVSYEEPGLYSVTLIATNAFGYDTEFRYNYISVTHCYASGECSDYITGVELNEIQNMNFSCGENGYSDYTDLTSNLVPGKQYPVIIHKNNLILEGEKCGIWFDWNSDNDFTDPEEFVELNTVENSDIFSGMFTTPLDSPFERLYKMRVRIIHSGDLQPCGFTGPGETEDYSVFMLKPEIFVSPDFLDFGGIVRFHCSEPMTYTVSANNLNSPLFITASPDMSVSLYPDTDFSPALSLDPVNNSVPETTIYVKFCIYWTTGEYEYISNSSLGAETKNVTLHGVEVIPPTGNAPETHIAEITSMPDTIIVLPVTTRGFTDVQFGYLNITYDSDKLIYSGIENINPEIDWWWIDAFEYPLNDQISNLSLNLDGSDNPRSIPDDDKLFDLIFTYKHSETNLSFDTTDCSWQDSWYHEMNDINADNYYFDGKVFPEAKLIELNLFLECLYEEQNSEMQKAQGETGNQYPDYIADMVTINLAQADPPYSILNLPGTKPLYQDGLCKFTLPLELSDNYYIVVNHRNSIETWSSSAISINSDYIEYRFSDAINKAYGNNLKLIGDKYCIFCGDINLDGAIDTGDMTLIDNDVSIFATGYLPTDLSGDGIVDLEDLSIIDNNAIKFIVRKRP